MGLNLQNMLQQLVDSNAFCCVYQKGKERKYYVPSLRESLVNLKDGYEPYPNVHPDNHRL
jgi:CRISPR-associated endonuclease Csn1